MAIGQVVTRIIASDRKRVDAVHAALDGATGQEKADALLLAMVEHIETINDEHHMTLARGIADALLANFSKKQ